LHIHRSWSTSDEKDAARKLSVDLERLQFAAASPEALPAEDLSAHVQQQTRILLRACSQLTGFGSTPGEEFRNASSRKLSAEEAEALLEEFLEADLPALLVELLHCLGFEARKDAMNLCCAILRPGLPRGLERQVTDYFRDHSRFLEVLIRGASDEATALHCGVILRSCARHKELARAFLEKRLVLDLLSLSAHPNLDISSDAVTSLQAVLLEHKAEAAAWLEENCEAFFRVYNKLLASGNYVLEREALALLSKILRDKTYYHSMIYYVSDVRHLQIVMNLLKEASKTIPLEAFNIFKLFVANPNRPPHIAQILCKNQERLINVLQVLRKPDDNMFLVEQAKVIQMIRMLGSQPSLASAPADCKSTLASMGGAVIPMHVAVAAI
jgi:calcium binding protein 39